MAKSSTKAKAQTGDVEEMREAFERAGLTKLPRKDGDEPRSWRAGFDPAR